MVEPVYEKLNYCQKIAQIKEQISLSAKSSVSCQEIDSVLSVSPFAVIDSIETLQGKIKYSGRINFFVCYLDKQNAIKKCECAGEFNGQISNDLIEEDAKVSLTSIIEKSSVELNGALLTANAILSLDASLTKQFEQNAVSGGKNIFVQERKTGGIYNLYFETNNVSLNNLSVFEVKVIVIKSPLKFELSTLYHNEWKVGQLQKYS